MSTFSSISHTFRHNLRAAGYNVALGHCQQAIAAALGFNSLAAFQASALSTTDLQSIGHLVINEAFILNRLESLGTFPSHTKALAELIAALEIPQLPATIYPSLAGFQDALLLELEHVVEEDSDVVSAVNSANCDGIDEIYLPFDLEDELTDDEVCIDIKGHIGLGVDTERPFAGDKVNVEATITMERLSPSTFSEVEYFVQSAHLDYGWAEPSRISFALALADELGITEEEAEELVDVEPRENTSDDGSATYSITLDFEEIAFEPLRSKLIELNGSLRVDVHPSFFDNVQTDIY
ncbi:hypothetical protein NP444_03610 [Pseudomonas aeruginosa]|uniref:hypothetical protein n=1 Tax=Pseudomonas aeruginosa TaxID=287 RepID=UPI0021170879|nr:hypothetical protein [Pseudomonas aeruginosa]UUH88014.1 hypothetical protein NP444_03610 [Pseudomonas aeruginosa]HCR1326672.1 hypothetical protein [Pseudomonas aeruginosa]